MGAVGAGFLLRSDAITWPEALLILGVLVFVCSAVTYLVTFSPQEEKDAKEEYDIALAERQAAAVEKKPWIPVPQFATMMKDFKPIDALRVYLGIALVVKGIYFVMNMHEIEGYVVGFDNFEITIAWYVVFVHIVGGFTLALGLATRIASALNITVLLGAVFFVHSVEGLFSKGQGMEFSLFVLFALILVLWQGAGKISVDHYLKPQAAGSNS